MKKLLLILAPAALLFASCDKELREEPAPEKTKTVLTVSAAATKTTLGGLDEGARQIYWANDDRISVNGSVSDPLSGITKNTVTSTDFTFEDAVSAPYKTVYPASIWKDATTVTLPRKATSGVVPLGGVSDASPIPLAALTSMLKVSIKLPATDPDTDNIKYIEVSTAGTRLSGDFSIDFDTSTLTPAASPTEDDCKVWLVVNQALSPTAKDFFIPVPAGTYSFTVTVRDANGDYMTKSTTSAKTFTKGEILALTAFDFIPTATDTGIEIDSAEKLIDFAQKYNNHEYDDLGSGLIATLVDDIDDWTAESIAAFNATKGIGLKVSYYGDAEDFYFDGFFNGNNHTISGLAATVPLFKATSQASRIADLTVDNTCSFTFTHSKVAELDAGAVVGYHRGILSKVNVAADVSLASVDAVNKVTSLGGLVGRLVVGSVDSCVYSGNITVPDGFVVDTQKTYIGGLVGQTSNAEGTISGSDFEGTIDFAGIVASTSTSDPYLYLGGVIGNNVGTVSGCKAKATNTKAITMDNSTVYTATIQNHSRKVYHMAQGGIAGHNGGTVSSCTNSASTKNFVLTTATNGGTASNDNSRYYDLGGIVGLNKAGATVTGCTNSGLIESRSTPRIQKVGGVVGYNLGTVSSSSNEGNLAFASATGMDPYNMRVGEVGGVIGNNGGTVSAISNSGNITISRTENAAGVELKFGGVIGLTTTAIDGGAGKSISNSGDILDSYNGTTVTTAGLRFGGVVGSAQASVQNVINTGKVTFTTSSTNVVSFLYMGGIAGEIRGAGSATVSGCENGGEVYFNAANNAAHTDNCAGGIIGKTFSDVTISNCSNSGYIHGGNASKQNGKTMYVGGIVAYLDGASSVNLCTNTGKLLNNQFNNTNTKVGSTFEGGIAGFVVGTDTDRITISNVTNNYNSGATITGGRRGYTGGTVGYGEYVDISNASNANSYGGGSGYWIGGIAGWLVNSTVSSSTYTGTSIESSQVQGAGGIVCTLDAGSTLDGCYSYLNSITHGANACVDGGLAAKSVAGSTIKNCHHTGTYGICSDTNYTDGGGNDTTLPAL